MTARIEVSGELMADPHSRVIGGVRMAGAPLFVVLPAAAMAGGREGETGPAVLFVTATGDKADALAGCRKHDAVRLAKYEGDGGERESFARAADSVEPSGPRH